MLEWSSLNGVRPTTVLVAPRACQSPLGICVHSLSVPTLQPNLTPAGTG